MQDDKLALERPAGCPTVTFAWSVVANGPLITGMATLVVRFAWCCFVDHLYHQRGNCGMVVTARRRAHHSASGAEAMCALSRRQSLLSPEGTSRGLGCLAEVFEYLTPREGGLAREALMCVRT